MILEGSREPRGGLCELGIGSYHNSDGGSIFFAYQMDHTGLELGK